jgi:hypothetical protein
MRFYEADGEKERHILVRQSSQGVHSIRRNLSVKISSVLNVGDFKGRPGAVVVKRVDVFLQIIIRVSCPPLLRHHRLRHPGFSAPPGGRVRGVVQDLANALSQIAPGLEPSMQRHYVRRILIGT